METSNLLFSSEQPYPPVEVQECNPLYGRLMLDNIGGSNSEISAVTLYFYNNLVVNSHDDISYIFHKVSIVEMHHLEIFGKLAFQLGENPRLWTYKNKSKKLFYWTPGYNKYPMELSSLLLNAINGECTTVEKYENQLKIIKDANIIANLKRIIEDEKLHIDIFQKLYKEYC